MCSTRLTNAVVSTILVGSAPFGVAISPNGARLYVTNLGSDSVSVIDTATNAVVATIPVGAGPWGVAVSPAGNHVYVSNTAEAPNGAPKENTVSVIDTSTNVEVTTLPPVGQNPMGLVATASHVYVAHAGSDLVSVIDV